MGFFREADKVAGDILKDFRGAIIFLGRLLLLSTFVEDGFRMWHQWEGKFILHFTFFCINFQIYVLDRIECGRKWAIFG